MTATHSSSAAPFILTVAPSDTTNCVMPFETPSFFSTASRVKGSVAPDEAVENAVSIGADMLRKCCQGRTFPAKRSSSGRVKKVWTARPMATVST